MSYQYRILKDYPIQAYPLNADETAPADVSGNSYVSSMTTTPVLGPPLVMGGGNSFVVSSANKLTFSSPVFTGSVDRSFSIELWFKPVTTGTILLLGHTGGRDGLFYDGESISFVTSHGDAGESRARYYPPELAGSFHAVGVHSKNKNQLYVNRVLVAESDLTDEQVLAGYDNTDNNLNSGITYGGTPSVLIDSVAVYPTALTPNQISNHFLAGRETVDFRDVSMARGGSSWDLTDNSALIGWQKDFNDNTSWNSGIGNGVNFQGGELRPSFDNEGLTSLGYWRYGQGFTVPNPLGGSKIEWDGDGTFVIQSSIDGESSWQNCVNGQEIPGLTEGTTITNKDFSIRITLPAGEPSTTITKVKWLSVKLYNDRNLSQVVSGRTIDLTGNVTLASDIHQPIEQHDDMGLDLYNGSAVISTDASEIPQPVRVLDMWVKVAAQTTVSSLTTLTGATTYVNGLTGTTVIPNQWAHVVAVLGADFLGSFTINSGTQVGALTIYPVAMTAAQVLDLYNSYIGAYVTRVNDTQNITVVDPANGIKLYQFDWTPAGV